MNIDELTKLLSVIVQLIEAISWPLIMLMIVAVFRVPLLNFIEHMKEAQFKGPGGFEATVRADVVTTAVSLALASEKAKGEANKKVPGTEDRDPRATVRDIVNVVAQSVTPSRGKSLAGASLLWVDDSPSNNVYEMQALKALGVRVTTSPSTDDALAKLRANKYHAIISDMDRPGDHLAGYTLLAQLHNTGNDTPFILYSSSSNPKYREEAVGAGAFGETNRPEELFQLVMDAIRQP